MRKENVIWYSDELNDEFSGDHIRAKKIDGSYRYLRGEFLHKFWYRIVAVPLAKIYMKLYFSHEIVNKEVLGQAGESGYILYGNHTHFLADALVPTMVSLPKDIWVIVHPNNVSMPVLGKITPYLGALPLPDDKDAMNNFLHAVKTRLARKDNLMIYPEAHIWPYYINIRPFTDASFKYPVKYHAPVYCITNTYQKKKGKRHPQMVTYVDGPFYTDETLPAKEQRKNLRDMVYHVMKERAKKNTIEKVHYRKIQNHEEK